MTNKPTCHCGSRLTRICPVCRKHGNVPVDVEQMFNVPIGWIKVNNDLCNLPPECPPYFVCSNECYEEFLVIQKLLNDMRNGDPNVIVEKLENGMSRIYRKESGDKEL